MALTPVLSLTLLLALTLTLALTLSLGTGWDARRSEQGEARWLDYGQAPRCLIDTPAACAEHAFE